jgi:hypothetical protein
MKVNDSSDPCKTYPWVRFSQPGYAWLFFFEPAAVRESLQSPAMGSEAAGRQCSATASLAGILLLAATCPTALKIDSETYNADAIARQRTFAWGESQGADQTRSGPNADESPRRSIERAVIEELTRTGYVIAPFGGADLLVSFHVVLT